MSVQNEKTNAARLLDRAKIAYQVIAYQVDESDLSAIHVADQLNEPIEKVYKTLVLKGDKTGFFVSIIPGAENIDLKKMALHSGNKSCDMIPMKDLLSLTGYIRGACSPLGMKKQFQTFIDDSCMNHDHIFVSAGKRGLQLQLSPKDLIHLINAKIVSCTKTED
jgi:Cys-tRNA(Pro)/Cys-tRNA(Cys) deacylase